jgi:hypothetical protein
MDRFDTRKEQVLERLQDAMDTAEIEDDPEMGWVDGPDLSNEKCGGTEGMRRLRELRAEGWPIEDRHHPDPNRDIWQYRLLGPQGLPPGDDGSGPRCPKCHAAVVAGMTMGTLSADVTMYYCPKHKWVPVRAVLA